MFRILALLFLSFSCAFLNAQVVGDYQSVATGNWNALATWQSWNGAAWVPAVAIPNNTNNTITIQSPNVVTVTAAVTIDQVVINPGATLQNTAAIVVTISNSGIVASELIVNGTYIENGNASVVWNAGATWNLGAAGTYVKTGNTSAANWQANYDGGIATIPATSNWISRKIVAANPPLITIGAYYGNLIIENNVAGIWNTATTSTFQGVGGNPIIKGNFDIGGAGTSTVNFLNQHTSVLPTQVLGNVIIRLGSILSNNGTGLELQGNLTVTGSLNYGAANSRRLDFTGGNAQSVSGAGTLNVYNCTLNKTGNSVTLNRAMTVDNVMTFTVGIINTTAANLLTINTNGSVAGANNTSFVNGPCRYVGLAAFTFPVGKNVDYQALSYNASAGGGGTFWTENFNNGCVSNCAAATYVGVNGAWTVTNTGANGPTPNLWFVSCAENGNTPGVGGSACGAAAPCGAASASNATLHMGAVGTSDCGCLVCPAGDCGAAYDACDGFTFCGGSPMTDKRAESPTINCTGRTTISVNFDYIENGQTTLDNATLWYFDGAVWAQIDDPPKTLLCGGQGIWAARSVVLPASANNNPNVKIGFRWVNNADGAGADPSFAVDDVTLSTAPTACDFTCEYFYANPQVVYNNVLAPTLNSISACEYWILTRNAGVQNKIVTLTWDGNSCPAIPLITDTRVAHFDLAMWQDEGNGGNTGTIAAGTVTSAAPVTYYGPFTIGLIPPVPLPIEMLRFDGICTGHSIQVNWSTGTENNNDYFTIERSIDGQTFSSVGIVDGAGNSDHLINYSFSDRDPAAGINYYRIRQTDFNGQYSISKIIAVNSKDCNARNLILNNVFFTNSDLEVDYFNGEGPVTIEIYSADGKLVKQVKQLPLESNYHIETNDMSSSIYFIRITDGISSITKTIQK